MNWALRAAQNRAWGAAVGMFVMACIFTVAAISSWMNGNKENALGSLALTLIAIGGVIYSVYYARALDRVAEKAVIE